MRRIPVLLLLVFAVLVASGCGQFGKRYEGEKDASRADTGEEKAITDEPFNAAARKEHGCTEIEEFESEGSTHVSDPDEQVEYENNPPHSGDHYEIAIDWGLYDKQQPDEHVVHNMEHGHLVISHNGLTQKQEDELYDQARINPYHLIVMPRDENPKDGVYYTAWTAQLYCKTPSPEALQYMIDNWRDQGPELFTDDPGGVMNVE